MEARACSAQGNILSTCNTRQLIQKNNKITGKKCENLAKTNSCQALHSQNPVNSNNFRLPEIQEYFKFMLFTQFYVFGDQKTPQIQIFLNQKYVFYTWPSKNIDIYNIFAKFDLIIFQYKNYKNIVFYRIFYLDNYKKMKQKYSKNRPGRPPFSDRIFLANLSHFFMIFWYRQNSPKIHQKIKKQQYKGF